MTPDPPPTDPFTEQEAEDLAWATEEGGGSATANDYQAIGNAVGSGIGAGALAKMKALAAYIRTLR